MTALRQRMMEDMQLRGLAPRTQAEYARAVSNFAVYYGKSPDQISDEELRQYFVYLTHERQLARSSCTVALCAIKFLYEYTLNRPWPLMDLVRPKRTKTVPIILSTAEVACILSRVRQIHHRVCLTLIYACGLRISEGVGLQVKDIDSARMQLVIRSSKATRTVACPCQNLSFSNCVSSGSRTAIRCMCFSNAGEEVLSQMLPNR